MLIHSKIHPRKPGYALLITLLFLFACESNPSHNGHDHSAHAATSSGNAQVDALEKEVLAIHDEVMPKMEDLMRLKREAKAQLAKDSADISRKEQLQTLIGELDSADEAMMGWMRNYDHDMTGKSPEEKLNYLQAEKVKITKVKEQMLTTLAKAQKTIQP